MTRHSSTAGNKNVAPSALDELLDAEREIAEQAARVGAECAAALGAARDEVAAIEREGATALERELAEFHAAAAAARQTEGRALAAAADARIRRFESLPPAEVERLAEVVAARVTGLSGAGAAAGAGAVSGAGAI